MPRVFAGVGMLSLGVLVLAVAAISSNSGAPGQRGFGAARTLLFGLTFTGGGLLVLFRSLWMIATGR